MIVKASTLLLLNIQLFASLSLTLCLSAFPDEKEVVFISRDRRSRVDVLDLVGLKRFPLDKGLSKGFMNTSVTVLLAIIRPVKVLLFDGYILDVPCGSALFTLVYCAEDICWMLIEC